MADDASAQTCAVRKGRENETADAKTKRMARTIAEPVLDAGWNLEFSVHKLTPATMEDARVCFQNELDEEMTRQNIDKKDRKAFLVENLLGVPTWQPAPRWESILKGDWASYDLDLSLYPNQEVNQVRKQLYNKLVAWAGAMREALKTRGYWCNTACPITGSCMFGDRTAHIYNELTGLTMMLNYDSIPIGCCGIVLHPTWGRCIACSYCACLLCSHTRSISLLSCTFTFPCTCCTFLHMIYTQLYVCAHACPRVY